MEGEESSVDSILYLPGGKKEAGPHIECAIYLVTGRSVQASGSASTVASVIDQYPDACRVIVHLNGGVGTAGGKDPRANWLLLATMRAIENRELALHPRPGLGIPAWEPMS